MQPSRPQVRPNRRAGRRPGVPACHTGRVSPDSPLPTPADVAAAAERIGATVIHTPLLRLPIDDADGAVYVKPESLQRTGSFKLRGALNFLASLPTDVRRRGVVTHSSGNHAQGVAFAARAFGVPATIVIPEGAPEVKVAGTRALGARVLRCENTSASRHDTAQAVADETGATLVPPYDHPWIVAGQGTVGLEIAADLPDVANVLVPIGGGGLSSGVSLALSERAPAAQVLGVEPALAADAHASLASGTLQSWPAEQVTRTMADGVRTQSIGALPFALLRRHLAGVVRVEERAIATATAWYARAAHLVMEPTGALSLAGWQALRDDPEAGLALRPGPTVLIASGGNVDMSRLCALLEDVPR